MGAVAANKACLSETRGTMKTRSLNTEILYNLSSSKNITDSLVKFGVGDTDSSLLVAVVDNSLDEVREVVNGDWVDVEEVKTGCDTDLIAKTHKLKQEEMGKHLVGSLVSRIAAKEALS